MKKEEGKEKTTPATKSKGTVVRTQEDLDRKKRLITGPELFIVERGSDEGLERLSAKVRLMGGGEFDIDSYLLSAIAVHHTRFTKDWFYRLADLFGVDRKVMDTYVKPNFVRLFIIQFVYARFPYLLLRTLRSRNRKLGQNAVKLHQHLSDIAVEQLEAVINDVYNCMVDSKSPIDFKMKYSKEHKVFFQTELF